MKVVVAIDSSPGSNRVLEEVAARPWEPNTTFCIVSSVDVGRFAELPVLIEDARSEAQQVVKKGADILARAGHQATTQVITGSPRKEISAFALEWGADLIFVGSHGHGTVGRFLLGSAAQGILRTARCSVEIVRYYASVPAPSSRAMKILLATDGSDCSAAAVRCVAGRLWPIGTVIKILSVEELLPIQIPMGASPMATPYPASLLEELVVAAHTRAEKAIDAAQKHLSQAGVTTITQTPIPIGDPRSLILDCAQSWQADLIVVGSHGRRGLDRFLMGSVAESVAVRANCSVEVIRLQSVSIH